MFYDHLLYCFIILPEVYLLFSNSSCHSMLFSHRDYLGSLLIYLQQYTRIFNAVLSEAGSKKEMDFSPTRIFSQAPSALMGQLMIDDGIAPKMLRAAAEYVYYY